MEKYMLTVKEAAAYFNIGVKKMRRLAEDHTNTFAVYCGNRVLIIRREFEKYMKNHPEVKETIIGERSDKKRL